MPDPLPGPIRSHSAGPPRDQDQHAMQLALHCLRAQAYRGGSDVAASAERGEAIDALTAALGYTALVGPIRGDLDAVHEFELPKLEPGWSPAGAARPGTLEQRLTAMGRGFGERLDHLEQLLEGDPPDRVSVLRQLEALATTLGVIAEQLERKADRPSARRRHDDGCALPDAHTGPCRDPRGVDLTIPF